MSWQTWHEFASGTMEGGFGQAPKQPRTWDEPEDEPGECTTDYKKKAKSRRTKGSNRQAFATNKPPSATWLKKIRRVNLKTDEVVDGFNLLLNVARGQNGLIDMLNGSVCSVTGSAPCA